MFACLTRRADQAAVGALYARLREYVAANQLGWAMLAPADIVFSPQRLVQPDVFVVPSRPEGEPRAWSEVTALLLAVEVISPSTARADRHAKPLIYQQEGVNEYWIVDCDARLVDRWRPADTRAEVLSESLVWHPCEDAPVLHVGLPVFLAEVTGTA